MAKSRQIRVEIDLITSASCRDAVFTLVPSRRRTVPSEGMKDGTSNSRECESVARL